MVLIAATLHIVCIQDDAIHPTLTLRYLIKLYNIISSKSIHFSEDIKSLIKLKMLYKNNDLVIVTSKSVLYNKCFFFKIFIFGN